MSESLVTINLVVFNGQKYIRNCLDAILAQTYSRELIEFNILDNGSTDNTQSIIQDFNFPRANLVESKLNLGMWPGQEELLKYTNGKYVLAVAVDVILDKDFIKNAVEIMEKNPEIGGLEAKIYKYDLINGRTNPTKIIDTCGFEIYKSRRIVNVGHGENDNGQFNEGKEIFGVEGAAPFFRKKSLEDCKIDGKIIDNDFFWYGDDLDLAWRMNLFGWKQIFAPSVIAWHDRQTTKGLRKSWSDFVRIRKEVPMKKRRLDWRNTRFTIVKNDYTINILKDLPYIAKRELLLLGYILFFEPEVLLEIPAFIRFLPRNIEKRKEVMRKAKVSAQNMHKWFK